MGGSKGGIGGVRTPPPFSRKKGGGKRRKKEGRNIGKKKGSRLFRTHDWMDSHCILDAPKIRQFSERSPRTPLIPSPVRGVWICLCDVVSPLMSYNFVEKNSYQMFPLKFSLFILKSQIKLQFVQFSLREIKHAREFLYFAIRLLIFRIYSSNFSQIEELRSVKIPRHIARRFSSKGFRFDEDPQRRAN